MIYLSPQTFFSIVSGVAKLTGEGVNLVRDALARNRNFNSDSPHRSLQQIVRAIYLRGAERSFSIQESRRPTDTIPDELLPETLRSRFEENSAIDQTLQENLSFLSRRDPFESRVREFENSGGNSIIGMIMPSRNINYFMFSLCLGANGKIKNMLGDYKNDDMVTAKFQNVGIHRLEEGDVEVNVMLDRYDPTTKTYSLLWYDQNFVAKTYQQDEAMSRLWTATSRGRENFLSAHPFLLDRAFPSSTSTDGQPNFSRVISDLNDFIFSTTRSCTWMERWLEPSIVSHGETPIVFFFDSEGFLRASLLSSSTQSFLAKTILKVGKSDDVPFRDIEFKSTQAFGCDTNLFERLKILFTYLKEQMNDAARLFKGGLLHRIRSTPLLPEPERELPAHPVTGMMDSSDIVRMLQSRPGLMERLFGRRQSSWGSESGNFQRHADGKIYYKMPRNFIEVTLGREASTDGSFSEVIHGDGQLSGRHAKIMRLGANGFSIKPIENRLVAVNGLPISTDHATWLKKGDEITLTPSIVFKFDPED